MSELNNLLKNRNSSNSLWYVGKSSYSGHGIIASRDINLGELIFNDFPIVVGPRTSGQLSACVGCFNVKKPLKECRNKCHLPVCSIECENSPTHMKECNFFKQINLNEDSWSNNLYKSLAPLRCLFLNNIERSIVQKLHSNSTKSVQKYVDVIKNTVGNLLKDEDITWIQHCCGVLHGTAYEIELNSEVEFGVQGLFPLAAMMNHNCSPNTRHYYGCDDPYNMHVVASKFIKKGEEITTHYCPLLWTTNARRIFLDVTKEFLCTCTRCQDPTEFESYVSALVCKCKGSIVPISPLVFSTDWKCNSCLHLVTALEVAIVQTTAEKMSQTRIDTIFHSNNSFRIQQKFKSINKLLEKLEGIITFFFQKNRYIESFARLNASLTHFFIESSNDQLIIVKKYAQEILEVINKLKLGETRTKGILCLRLYKILQEEQKRNIPIESKDMESYYMTAKRILNNDNTAPKIE